MTKQHEKLESTDEAWESRALGASAAHVQAASTELEAAIESSLGMQAISIRLPKDLIDAYKLIANHHGIGYQPLMRDILQRFVPDGLKEVMEHHALKAGEVDLEIEKRKKVA